VFFFFFAVLEVESKASHILDKSSTTELSTQPNLSYVGSLSRKIIAQAGLGQKQDPIPKITKANRAKCMAQVVDHLLGNARP
jgi:hypothetical protein